MGSLGFLVATTWLGLLLAQCRGQPPHLFLERLAVIFLRLGANVTARREHVAVLADLFQRGALAEAGDVLVFARSCSLTPALSRRERG